MSVPAPRLLVVLASNSDLCAVCQDHVTHQEAIRRFEVIAWRADTYGYGDVQHMRVCGRCFGDGAWVPQQYRLPGY